MRIFCDIHITDTWNLSLTLLTYQIGIIIWYYTQLQHPARRQSHVLLYSTNGQEKWRQQETVKHLAHEIGPFFLLPSIEVGINRKEHKLFSLGLTIVWLSRIYGYDTSGRISHWGNTLLTWMHTVMNRYLFLFDIKCLKDIKLQEPANNWNVVLCL